MAAQPGQLLPGLAAVGRAEQRRVFHPGVDGIGIGQRRFEMPDALELPGVLRAVVPLVSAGIAVVLELVADGLPGLAAVVRALDHLPEPAAGLRRIEPVRVGRRALEVVDLPAREVGAADLPLLALAVGRQDERAFARADQNSYSAHCVFLPGIACRTLLFEEARAELNIASLRSAGRWLRGRRQTRNLHDRPDFDGAQAGPGIRAAMPIAASRSLASIRK